MEIGIERGGGKRRRLKAGVYPVTTRTENFKAMHVHEKGPRKKGLRRGVPHRRKNFQTEKEGRQTEGGNSTN